MAYSQSTESSVFPPVIKNLLILNGLVFLAQLAAQMAPQGWLAQVITMMALYPPGAPEIGYTVVGTIDQIPGFWPWQLVTYAFLHGGLTHILFNMFALWMFGIQIERSWGSRRFTIYYFVCVVGAGVTQMFVMWGVPVPTIGASGGVFGILLAFGMMFPDQRIMLLFPPIPIKAKWFVIGYGAIELWAGISNTQSGVAHFAHLGGMVFGFILIQYWRGKLPKKPEREWRW